MGGLSKDARKRANQLANLKRGRPAKPIEPAPPGNSRARIHGGYGAIAEKRLDTKAREVFDALASDAPVQERGHLPRHDHVVVRQLATALCRIENIETYLAEHGWKSEEGDPRPVLEYERKLHQLVLAYLEQLGMTPAARAKLGIDMVRGRDALAEMEAEDRRRVEGKGGDDGAA
jgi:hypothetical protein